jgi:hypothetical protein
LKWPKVRGGVQLEWVGYWLDFARFEIGVSAQRAAWAATWLSEIDMDPHGISLFLGHSSFSSINKYIATNPKMAKCSLNFEGIPLQSEVYHD